MKNTQILNPVLQRTLDDYGIKFASPRRKKAEEAQDGVDSELKAVDDGNSVSEDSLFASESDLIDFEGGQNVSDGQIAIPETPSGEQSTFDNYMTGESGGTETKKTVTDPGYQPGASPSSELTTSGSTVEKGAAFMSRIEKFASTQQNFVNKIAWMAKIAEGLEAMADPTMAGADPASMQPEAAMAGMMGPGQGGGEELGDESGLSPDDEALIEAIIERESGENPLSPEEKAQLQMILTSGGDDGGGELPPELMGGAEADGELPPELMGAEGGMPMEEPPLTPDESKLASLIAHRKLAEDDEEGGSDDEESGASDGGGDEASCSDGGEDSCSEELSEPSLSDDEKGDLNSILNAEPGIDAGEAAALGVGGEPELGMGAPDPTLVAVLDSMSGEDLAELITAIVENTAEPEEPDIGRDEQAEMIALAQADSEDEFKQASYYGMSIPEYRKALAHSEKQAAEQSEGDDENSGLFKGAMLQAKNAEQSKKAKRYGQTIDSLIRK